MRRGDAAHSSGLPYALGAAVGLLMAEDKGGPPEHVAEFGKGHLPPPEADGRLDAPAFHRNHAPILEALRRLLAGRSGDVLEIGSGTGQHAVEFCRALPDLTWWPSDHLESHMRSIAAWRVHAKLENLQAPTQLDASAADWRLAARGLPNRFMAMFCANVVHIAPWAVAEGIFAAAARHLAPDGRLLLYGPFRREGVHNSPGNEKFDEGLRRDNPEWGVRDTADLKALGAANGLRLADLIEMPANNAVLVFTPA
jgi:SAM-dependent methyltransferase